MDREVLLGLVSEGLSLDAIGRSVGRSPSTVSYWLAKHGIRANGAETFAPRGGLSREILEPLVNEGLTISEIAERVACSSAMVRHWLARHELKTRAGRNREIGRAALAAGELRVVMDCATHGPVDHVLEPRRGSYRCTCCRAARVTEHRRKIKRVLISEAGGCCTLCGYRRCPAALEFHHVDPAMKDFHLSMHGLGRSLSTLRAEASKCVLLCANCHAEVEVGFQQIPAAPTYTADEAPVT